MGSGMQGHITLAGRRSTVQARRSLADEEDGCAIHMQSSRVQIVCAGAREGDSKRSATRRISAGSLMQYMIIYLSAPRAEWNKHVPQFKSRDPLYALDFAIVEIMKGQGGANKLKEAPLACVPGPKEVAWTIAEGYDRASKVQKSTLYNFAGPAAQAEEFWERLILFVRYDETPATASADAGAAEPTFGVQALTKRWAALKRMPNAKLKPADLESYIVFGPWLSSAMRQEVATKRAAVLKENKLSEPLPTKGKAKAEPKKRKCSQAEPATVANKMARFFLDL
eukprot:3765952-Amphidinium_carterae.1